MKPYIIQPPTPMPMQWQIDMPFLTSWGNIAKMVNCDFAGLSMRHLERMHPQIIFRKGKALLASESAPFSRPLIH